MEVQFLCSSFFRYCSRDSKKRFANKKNFKTKKIKKIKINIKIKQRKRKTKQL